MKKLFLIFLLGISIQGFSQEGNKGKTDIYVGYGIVTAQDIISITSTALVSALVPGGFDKVDANAKGAVFLGFDRYLNDRVSLGLQFNYSSFDATYFLNSGSTINTDFKFLTPMARFKGNWVNRPAVQLYSALAAGATFMSGDDNNGTTDRSTAFAFQVSPIGVRVGNTFSFFAEAGFGYQGLLSVGLALKL